MNQCKSCEGHGVKWSNSTLVAWRSRGETSPPPDQWRDQNCKPCKGAGWFGDTGEPLWEKLIKSAIPRYARTARRVGARRRRPPL